MLIRFKNLILVVFLPNTTYETRLLLILKNLHEVGLVFKKFYSNASLII